MTGENVKFERMLASLPRSLQMNAGLGDLDWVRFLGKWLGISLVLHLVASVMNVGFYDMDEHFQVMEFVSYKLGRTPASKLAYEFGAHCRSWLQPTLYELLARIWIALGVVRPAIWATSFRVFSGIIGWLSLLGMALCSYSWFRDIKFRKLAVMFMAFLYFLPYLHARTSSESLGGSFFFIAVAIFVLSGLRQSGVAGFLFGLAFLSRFQMGFAILGFGLWCLIERIPLKRLVTMSLGFFAVVGIGVLVDWRGFGVWTFSPFNYFWISLVQGVAAATGSYPWWYYFKFLQGDVPLLGNLLALGVVLGWIAKPRHPLTLPTFFFVIVHMCVAHKEPRYLFPLISAIPILVIFGCELVSKYLPFQNKIIFRIPFRIVKNSLYALNFGGLVVATLKPAAVQPLLHTYLFDHQDEIRKVSYVQTDPFNVIGLQMGFYRPLQLEMKQATSLKIFGDELRKEGKPQWLYYNYYELPIDQGDWVKDCKLQYTVFPDFLRVFLFLPGIRISSKASLFKCLPHS